MLMMRMMMISEKSDSVILPEEKEMLKDTKTLSLQGSKRREET
jgi:hypothetical protein